LGIAWRRKIVKLLFFISLLPPLGMGIALVIRVMTRETMGVDLGWDPVLWLLRVQTGPVILLALGLGTPSVARDRSEEVLYLYAVRPVTPWTYTLGKMVAVALPTALLLLVPAILIAILRQGILGDSVTTMDSLLLVGKAAVASVFLAIGFTGVTVGPSAATRRARWALLIAVIIYSFPEPFKIFMGFNAFSITPKFTSYELLQALFEGKHVMLGVSGAAMLLLYGVLGGWLTRSTVAKEMQP